MTDQILTDEEIVGRILGLPLEKVEGLKATYNMPVSDPEFSEWFVANATLVLSIMKDNFEKNLFGEVMEGEVHLVPHLKVAQSVE